MWFKKIITNKRTSRGMRKPSAGCLKRACRGQRHNDLGAPLPYPWERAKPLNRAVAAAYNVCCVLCVCLLLCLVVFCVCASNFSYHTCKKSTLAKAKWPISSIHATKLALKHPKYDWLCKPVIIQRCCTRFEFLLEKAVLAVLWVHKKNC
jgi:hypothetical protein